MLSSTGVQSSRKPASLPSGEPRGKGRVFAGPAWVPMRLAHSAGIRTRALTEWAQGGTVAQHHSLLEGYGTRRPISV